MLYQHRKTGARVKIVSEWDNGDWFNDSEVVAGADWDINAT